MDITSWTASIHVDCDRWQGELRRIWASIGFDEINWTYTSRGKALFGTLHQLAETPYYIRNHNTLTSGNALSAPARGSTNVYHELPDGTISYSWDILDRVFDTHVAAGFHPIVELGFMPIDLAPAPLANADWLRDVGEETYESDGLWKSPPKDYCRWSELIYQLVSHCVARYGAAEVRRWRFEVWNEPNLPNYWRGTVDDYCRLYDYSVAGATRALTEVQIGGPAIADPAQEESRHFLRRFLEHCAHGPDAVTGERSVQLDFVSFHTKGAHYARRRYYNLQRSIPHESPSSAAMLRDIRAGLATVAEFSEFAHLPVLVDECDPAVGTIYGVYDNPNFVVTNTEYYPAFLVSLVKRILDLDRISANRVELMTTWAFLFEGKRLFEGNRTLVTNENIEKPVLNAFRVLGKLGHARVQATSDRARGSRDKTYAGDAADASPAATPDTDEIDALAALSGERVTVLVWRQADAWWADSDGAAVESAQVNLTIDNLPFSGVAMVRHYRIDGEHSNAYRAWLRMGSPDNPSPAQVAYLKGRQGLEQLEPPAFRPVNAQRRLVLAFAMPLFSVSLLEIEPARQTPPSERLLAANEE